MLVVDIVFVVVVVVLVVAVVRLRTRTAELEAEIEQRVAERDDARAETAAVSEAERATGLERDDALERVSRSRRDGAEVANRLSDEVAARIAVEGELESVRTELAEAQAAGAGGLAVVLWALSLRQTEQLWRLSVAVDPESVSPLDDATDPLRAAAEIEVDAAREESGADVSLAWSGTDVVEAERAVVALALIRDVIAELGTRSASTTIAVDCSDEAVSVTVSAIDAAGTAIPAVFPEGLEDAPGRARIT